MPTVNRLPKKGGKEPVLTFVGGGWKGATGGNYGGINKHTYINSDYWTSDGAGILCKKDFSALVVLMTQNSSDAGTRSRRTLYTQNGDILDTGTTTWTQVNRLYDFTVGDTLNSYQYNASSGNTLGCTMIYDINPR